MSNGDGEKILFNQKWILPINLTILWVEEAYIFLVQFGTVIDDGILTAKQWFIGDSLV